MHVVLCTISPEAAESLASTLVERRLAACVNIVPGVTSIYRWKGAVQKEVETLLVIKTAADVLPALLAELPRIHPYEVPEIVALPVAAVHPPYLAWVAQETSFVKSG